MRNHGRSIGVTSAVLMGLFTAVTASAADRDLRLIDAVKSQQPQRVRTLLSQHVDVNTRSDDGSTALLWSAHWNDVPTAELLITAGADGNLANDLRITPLSLACTNGSAALVELLLKAGANPNTPVATGETPLMTCAGSGSAEATRMLILRGADVNAKEPSQNQTALMWAAAENHPPAMRVLIEAGADLNARTRKGFTALHFVARQGNIEAAKLLLAAGVNVNARSQPESPETDRNASAASPSSGASSAGSSGGGNAGSSGSGNAGSSGSGNAGSNAGSAAGAPTGNAAGVVQPRGAAYQSTLSDGSTPLLVATTRGHVPFARFLLEQGADPNVGDAGLTPLHWAVGTWEGGVSNPVYGFSDPMSGIPNRQAKLELVTTLLAKGANPNGRMTRRPGFVGGYDDAPGATPLIIASAAADVEMMRILVAAGADPSLVTDTKTTAVMAASGLNRLIGESPITEAQALDAVKFLIELGADARGATTLGENALFGAGYRGWNTLLQLLIDKGADVNAVSKAGTTPWLAASGFGDRLGGVLYNKEGADLLLKHGADPKLGKPCQAQIKCR